MVKKKPLILLIIVTLAIFISKSASATSCGGVETSMVSCDEGGSGGIFHLLSLFLDIFSIGIGITAVIGIAVAGTQYLTSKGDPTNTAKAKRRLYEIIIGVVCYVVLWAGLRWLLPNSSSSTVNNNQQASELSISFSGTAVVGKTFSPSVTFASQTGDETYSLSSNNPNILTTIGTYAKCVAPGTSGITAVSSKGKTAKTDIECVQDSSSSGSSISPSRPSSKPSSKGSSQRETTGNMENTRFNGKAHLRAETIATINQHKKDFYYKNVDAKLKKAGGLLKYIQNLDKSKNGVFWTYASRINGKGGIKKIPVKTAADLQKASEFIYGLMMIWGVDYDIGTTYTEWKGNDAFYYPRKHGGGYSNTDIITFLKNKNTVRTNCNYSVSTFYKTTSLKSLGGVGSGKPEHIKMSKVGKITKWKDLKVGDIVHFFNGGDWKHVAMVGEVYSDKVVLYDGGPLFPKRMIYKIPTPRTNSKGFPKGTPYKWYTSWWAFRPWNIDQSVTLNGIN
ncbi:hypothetical protein IJI28_00650 [Candidatus Saccharibacteria bacterium]|nr:hypothetical protein [Candidatus Saccharibacteria bacterium]